MAKKYYWLKLKQDFFKQHNIRIIEEMENGKDYILFYLKLLVESISHQGHLRFSDTIPYNDKMLATITNTNVDIVRNAIKVFNELNLMEILDDGTIYMTETQKMIGNETDWARKKREYRARLQEQKKDNVLTMSDKSKSIDIELEKDIDISSNSLYDFVEENFGRTLSSVEYEEISNWEDNDLTRYAIKQAILNSAYSIKYINTILSSYKKKNIQTVQQAQEDEKKFKASKDKPYKQEVIEQKVPEWYDKKIEIKQASADEELKMKAMLSEFEEEKENE